MKKINYVSCAQSLKIIKINRTIRGGGGGGGRERGGGRAGKEWRMRRGMRKT
jgi:hypothetical protein